MTTTNVFSFVMRDLEPLRRDEVGLMPVIDRNAETKGFDKILTQLGTSVSSEKKQTAVDSHDLSTEKRLEKPEEDMRKEIDYGSKISEKIKSKETELETKEIDTEVVEEFSEEMVALMCQTLNITPEELMSGMEELGLSVGDLLEPANLANLFVHFGEAISVTDVLMSEDFQMVKVQVEELQQNLSTELGVSEEELSNLIKMETFEEATSEEVNQTVVNEDAVTEDVPEELRNAEKTADGDGTESKVVVVEEEQVSDSTELKQQTMDMGNDTNESTEEEMVDDSNTNKFEFEPTKNRKGIVHEEMSGQTIRQTTVITTQEGNVVQETVKVVDLQNLVSDLTEYVRLTSGNEFSKIEMQLNPANLGKMIVEVSSSNGEVTTKIITQTEAGKEAIESNISQMRTNLEQQGVKVAAVEVTVESHAFEHNLQGEQGREQQQLMKEQQEETRRHQKNLNLNEMTLDDLSGLMSEEEMLAVRMMQESGNTMDLTV